MSGLFDATTADDVRAALAAGEDIEGIDLETGFTPLLHATRWRHLDVARALIAAGANVHARSVSQSTALHHACRCGWVELVSVLIAANADVEALDRRSETPLLHAAHWHRIDVARALIAAGVAEHRGYCRFTSAQ